MNRIYIAGPLSHGDVYQNVLNAQEAANRLLDAGFSPFVPHWFYHLARTNPRDYEAWMAIDQAWLKVADGLIRIPGYSPGADREEAYATQHGIPVFHSLEALCRHFERAA